MMTHFSQKLVKHAPWVSFVEFNMNIKGLHQLLRKCLNRALRFVDCA